MRMLRCLSGSRPDCLRKATGFSRLREDSMLRRATQSLLLAIGVAAPAFTQVITTIVGTTFTFPSSPLPALSAPLGQTSGVAVDSNGNVYVADSGNNLVM